MGEILFLEVTLFQMFKKNIYFYVCIENFCKININKQTNLDLRIQILELNRFSPKMVCIGALQCIIFKQLHSHEIKRNLAPKHPTTLVK